MNRTDGRTDGEDGEGDRVDRQRPHKIEQRLFTLYRLCEIQLTGLTRRLATQQVGHDQTKKMNRGGVNCS